MTLFEESDYIGAVPECYIGLWQRRLLEDARGIDTRTQVYWLQSGSLYADIRLPVERNTAGGVALQQGFAGALEIEGSILTWRRWLDFQPPTAVADVGRIRFTGLDEMIEEGVHADYREVWERIGAASSDRAAFSLQAEYPHDGIPRRRAGVLVMVGDDFMFALDRLAALPAGQGLADLAVQDELANDLREQLFACEISLGRRHGPRPWEILHSTLPAHEGQCLFDVHGALVQTQQTHIFEQQSPDGGVRRIWRQVEQGARFHAF
ncbi:MAG: hypothetical protein HY941_13350 [Gammaproteobacteria bacterium]|nr:hypothetical protein [Gammaproteobacteria bacterium]